MVTAPTSARWIRRSRTTRSWQLLYATCAKLVNYPDSRPAGAQLIAGGRAGAAHALGRRRTYTFTIRPGFRFSQPPTGRSPRRRSRTRSSARSARGCTARSRALSRHRRRSPLHGRQGPPHLRRDRERRQAHHPARRAGPGLSLADRAAGLLRRPAEHADQPDGVRVIPSAGPYYVSSYTPGQGVVLTQPQLPRSRPRRFARIVLAVGITPSARRRNRGRRGRLHPDWRIRIGTRSRTAPAGRPLRARSAGGRARTPAVLRQPRSPARLLRPEHPP